MRNAGGYGVLSRDDGRVVEIDTFTCKHCQRIVRVPVKASPSDCGGWCALCCAPVCKACAGADCVPFEKQLEASERRGQLFRSLGL